MPRLAEIDPAAADMVHPNDRQRLVRALELADSGGSLVAGENRLWATTVRRPTLVGGLEVPAALLEARIRARTEEMFARGVGAEVEAALAGSVSRTAVTSLGLREIAELEPEAALERIVVRTRRYAAYQRKWMRRMPSLVTLDGTRDPDDLATEIVSRVGR